jgi:hypothetical protein
MESMVGVTTTSGNNYHIMIIRCLYRKTVDFYIEELEAEQTSWLRGENLNINLTAAPF